MKNSDIIGKKGRIARYTTAKQTNKMLYYEKVNKTDDKSYKTHIVYNTLCSKGTNYAI